jgi:alkanesulfonate monooxygenase SsuD/methylene tetrahydromethanopterin reductase-like flavin-dependent oxidoreductase (luciferase family)
MYPLMANDRSIGPCTVTEIHAGESSGIQAAIVKHTVDAPPLSVPFAPGTVSIGLYLPAVDPSAVASTLRDHARRAAAAGFDGVSVAEHHGQDGYVPNPILVATHLASVVGDRWVAAAPLLATLRSPRLIAEDIAWATLLTGDRFGVAMAAGYDEADFAAVGVPFEKRLARFRRAVTQVADELSGPGDPRTADPALSPTRRTRAPLLMASRGPLNCEHAARTGLGLFIQPLPIGVTRDLIDRYLSAGGSGPLTLTRWVWLGEHPRVGEERLNSRIEKVPGDLSWRDDDAVVRVESSNDETELAGRIASIVSASGATSLNIRVGLPGVGAEETIDQIERVGALVVPLLRQLLHPSAAPAETSQIRKA